MRSRKLATLAAVILIACTGNACTGNGDVQIGVRVGGRPGDPGPKPGLELTGAEMMVRDVILGGCDEDQDVHRRVWRTIDLLDPAASQINMLDVEAGVYHTLTLRIRARAGFAEGPDGQPVSIIITGTFEGDPFEFRDSSSFDIRLHSDAGILVDDGQIAEVVIQIDPAVWFADVNLAALVQSPDGTAYIDSTHNTKAYDDLHAQIAAAMSLLDQGGGGGCSCDNDNDNDCDDDDHDDHDDHDDDDDDGDHDSDCDEGGEHDDD